MCPRPPAGEGMLVPTCVSWFIGRGILFCCFVVLCCVVPNSPRAADEVALRGSRPSLSNQVTLRASRHEGMSRAVQTHCHSRQRSCTVCPVLSPRFSYHCWLNGLRGYYCMLRSTSLGTSTSRNLAPWAIGHTSMFPDFVFQFMLDSCLFPRS